MKVHYHSKKLEKICSNASEAEKAYGAVMAEKIQMRITQIKAASTIETMIQYHIGRCHPLTGDRKGQYAMDLSHPYRLVFKVKQESIEIAEIIEIVDYH